MTITKEQEMIEPSNGARTHEPSLRELTAELDGLRILTAAQFGARGELDDEREKRYNERDEARKDEVEKALAAADKMTAAAFAAAKEATSEAKKSQDQYNLSHNDLLRKMEKQSTEMVGRGELAAVVGGIGSRIDRLQEDLRSLRESRSELSGRGQGAYQLWLFLAGMVAVVSGLLAVGSTLYAILK